MNSATIIHQDGSVTEHIYSDDEGLDMALDSEWSDTLPLGPMAHPGRLQYHAPRRAGKTLLMQRLAQILGLR